MFSASRSRIRSSSENAEPVFVPKAIAAVDANPDRLFTNKFLPVFFPLTFPFMAYFPHISDTISREFPGRFSAGEGLLGIGEVFLG